MSRLSHQPTTPGGNCCRHCGTLSGASQSWATLPECHVRLRAALDEALGTSGPRIPPFRLAWELLPSEQGARASLQLPDGPASVLLVGLARTSYRLTVQGPGLTVVRTLTTEAFHHDPSRVAYQLAADWLRSMWADAWTRWALEDDLAAEGGDQPSQVRA